MSDATLTSGLTATMTYTSLAVTAMPVAAPVGEIVYVGAGLATVEPFVVSIAVAVGATTIHITSAVAQHSHSDGENVAPAYTLNAVGRTMSPQVIPRTHRL